jgi:hypothetical protein
MTDNIVGLKSLLDMLKGTCYLSRDDHERKIGARKQRPNIGKYCFINRIIRLWNEML